MKQRLVSLDVYRGLIMVTLAFNGFGLAATANQHLWTQHVVFVPAGLGQAALPVWEFKPNAFWNAVHYQFEHVEWAGCGYWDLIQPSFMFMVGVAMAFSYLKRQQQGQSWGGLFGHALWRSVVLIFLGIFLISNWATPATQSATVWSLMNVLTQIGLGYPFLFLLWGRSLRTQAITAGAILLATWLLYVLYPHSGANLASDRPAPGVTQQWAKEHLTGISPAWHKNANIGQAIDLEVLNRLPRSKAFEYDRGGYQTLNFLPSLATMIFGLMCGELLRSSRSAKQKLQILALAGVGGLVVGQVLALTGVCPLVKRIWTPSWALFSTGWCCLILAAFYGVVDVLQYRRWAYPLVVVGVNSIAIYCMSQLLKPWAARTLQIHLGKDVFLLWGRLWEPMVQAVLVGLMFWLACWWMYRQKIFVRI
jgi:predicted acyltransferase